MRRSELYSLVDGDDDDHWDHDEDIDREENQFDRKRPVLSDEATEDPSEAKRPVVEKFGQGEEDSG